MRWPARILGAALAAGAVACDGETREDCPDPPYTCATESACLHEGGSALNSYACPDKGDVCCDVP